MGVPLLFLEEIVIEFFLYYGLVYLQEAQPQRISCRKRETIKLEIAYGTRILGLLGIWVFFCSQLSQ